MSIAAKEEAYRILKHFMNDNDQFYHLDVFDIDWNRIQVAEYKFFEGHFIIEDDKIEVIESILNSTVHFNDFMYQFKNVAIKDITYMSNIEKESDRKALYVRFSAESIEFLS